jgi:hypothetical protein
VGDEVENNEIRAAPERHQEEGLIRPVYSSKFLYFLQKFDQDGGNGRPVGEVAKSGTVAS